MGRQSPAWVEEEEAGHQVDQVGAEQEEELRGGAVVVAEQMRLEEAGQEEEELQGEVEVGAGQVRVQVRAEEGEEEEGGRSYLAEEEVEEELLGSHPNSC